MHESLKILYGVSRDERAAKAETIAADVFGRLADYALAQSLAGNPLSPEVAAENFAKDQMADLQGRYGSNLGLVREANSARHTGNTSLVTYLPPAPNLVLDTARLPADLRDHVQIELFYESTPEDPRIMARYVNPKL